MDGFLSARLGITAQLHRTFTIPQAVSIRAPGPDPKKLAAYRRQIALLKPLGFRAENIGRVLVEDARITLEVPKWDGLQVVDELPEKPRGPMEIPRFGPFRVRSATRWTRVRDLGENWEIVATLGKIQPAATVWSLPFWIGSEVERELTLKARVFGDNIPKAIELTAVLKVDLGEGFLDDDVEDEGDEVADE